MSSKGTTNGLWGNNLKLTLDIKKKVLGVFNGSFLRNLVGGGHSFLFLKRGLYEKSLGNPGLD